MICRSYLLALALGYAVAVSTRPAMSRRAALSLIGSSGAIIAPFSAHAATDCMKDCLQNCNVIAPNNQAYCTENCRTYCDQEDRTDGLSGSISSTGGEMGILGINTVVKGEDKPPQMKLPGLDFSSDAGKKLIGY
jgi:hypothetical protein